MIILNYDTFYLLYFGEVLMKILTLILDLVIFVLNFIAKKTKATWDDALLRTLKLIRAALRLGGLRKK